MNKVTLSLSAALALLALAALFLTACFYRPRPATVPLRVLRHDQPRGAHTDLVVFLPGRGDLPEDFVRRGFLEIAQQAGLDADVLAVDSHLGYFLDRSIVVRLHDDVIAPAQARGYQRIWLAGISMGALGSILYIQEHPEDIAGVALIAPYLGEKPLLAEIERAGGLRAWQAAPFVGVDYQRETWRWLQAHYARENPDAPPLWLGYGRSDRYRWGDHLLAAVLPEERVKTAPGGHGWRAWRTLWADLLAAGALPRRPAR